MTHLFHALDVQKTVHKWGMEWPCDSNTPPAERRLRICFDKNAKSERAISSIKVTRDSKYSEGTYDRLIIVSQLH